MSSFFNPEGRISRRKYWIFFIVFYWTNLLALIKMYEAYDINDVVSFVAFGVVLITTII